MNEEKQITKMLKNSDMLKKILTGLGVFILFVLVFGAGVKVGEIKARFSYRWAENYHRNFAGPRDGFMAGGDWRKMPRGEFTEAHGVFGEIIEIKDNGFVIRGRGDVEKMVVTGKDTVIKKGIETSGGGLGVGDQVVVIGSPNSEGQIDAKFIRIFGEGIKLPMLPGGNSYF